MLEGMHKLPSNAKNTSTYRKSSPIEIGQIRRSWRGGGIGDTAKWLGKCVNSAHACPILILGGGYKLPNNVKTICTSTKAPPLEIGHMWGSGGGAHRMHSKVLTTFLNGSPPAPHVYPSTSFGELEEVKIVFMSLKSVFNTPE